MTAQPPPEPSGAEPSTLRDVQYKGAPLDAAKGPGLGCFWLQLAILVVLIVLTPLSVNWGWPELLSGGLLIATIVLLLFAGQTIIFLLRLVAADRRAEARRRPLQPRTPTVGQIEDEQAGSASASAVRSVPPAAPTVPPPAPSVSPPGPGAAEDEPPAVRE